jgi:putative hydrolase of the HAD superfamily
MIITVTDAQRGENTPAIRHVMFDADGVLQNLPGGWIAAAEPYFGERALEFLERSYEAELPTLAGQGDHLALVAATLAEFGVTASVGDVYRAIWLGMEPAAASLAVVRSLRRRGYGVHLGTNQERYRAAHMREVLGYDALFDVSCYSCELGAAKPDLAFFTEAARRIGAWTTGTTSSLTCSAAMASPGCSDQGAGARIVLPGCGYGNTRGRRNERHVEMRTSGTSRHASGRSH